MIVLNKCYFTLLELLIVIAILAIVGGLVSIGVNKALVDQRFRSEVALIVDDLRLAQDLMLILGTDVHLKFTAEKGDKDGKGIRVWLELDTPISEGIQRELLRKRRLLKTIIGVFFNDQLTDVSTEGQIDVRFQSRGAVMSRGVMRLATSDKDDPPANTLQSYICLAGYPRPIESTDDSEKAQADCKAAKDLAVDTKLTEDTFSKLPKELKENDLPESDEADLEDPKDGPLPTPVMKKRKSTSKSSASTPGPR